MADREIPRRPRASGLAGPFDPLATRDTPGPDGVGEDVWLDVIRKMDEVYSQLVQDEIALEEKRCV